MGEKRSKREIDSTFNDIVTGKNELWMLMLSACIALAGTFSLYTHSHTVLRSFSDRAIGISILAGVDASARSTIFIKMVLLFVLLFLVSLSLFKFIGHALRKNVPSLHASVEKAALQILSGTATLCLFIHLISRQEVYLDFIRLLGYGIVMVGILVLIKALLIRIKMTSVVRQVLNYRILALAFLFPVPLFFISWVLLEGDFTFNSWHLVGHFILATAFVVGYGTLGRSFGSLPHERNKIERSMAIAFIPYSLIPLSIPLVNEMQFSLSRFTNISPVSLSMIMIVLLLIAGVASMIMSLRVAIRLPRFSTVIRLAVFPIFVAAFSLYDVFRHVYLADRIEMLEVGAYVMPTQQLLSFHKIPFVDIWPAHGLFDMFFPTLYVLMTGDSSVAMMLWTSMTSVIGIVLIYLLTASLASPLFALCAVLFLPIHSIFPIEFTYVIVPTLCFLWTIKRPSATRYSIYWVSVLFSFIWRQSIGLAVIPAALVVTAGYIWKQGGSAWKIPARTGAAVAGSAVLFYLVLLLVKGRNVLETFGMILQYLRTDARIGAFPTIIREYSGLAVFQYLILPLIALSFVILFIITVLGKNRSLTRYSSVFAFLAAFSLVTSIRGLNRHCMLEVGFTPYLFIFLGVFSPYLLPAIKKSMAFILSLLVLVVYFIGFADVADKWQVNFSTVAKSRQLFEFKHWHRQEGRIAGNYYEQYRDLVQFMNRTLAPDQTFFEFINAPFLYFITGREGPELFFYQTHMFQTDPTQQAYLAKLEQLNKTNKVPIVIFKSQTWWGNAVDGVPCEVSCYRLAEYIYRTYRPLGYVGGYQIWVKKDMDTSGRTATIPVAQNFNLMKLPFIWGTYDSMQAATKTPVLGEFRMNDAVAEAGKAFALKFDPLLDKTTGNYLHFRLRTREEAMFTVAYGRAPQNTITFSVLPSYDYQDYLVRISSQWNWMNEPIDSILFQASSPVTIDRITIRKGD